MTEAVTALALLVAIAVAVLAAVLLRLRRAAGDEGRQAVHVTFGLRLREGLRLLLARLGLVAGRKGLRVARQVWLRLRLARLPRPR